jgi:hypothetical protein
MVKLEKLEFAMTEHVEYPEMRTEIVTAISELADLDFQKSNWLNPSAAAVQSDYDSFDHAFHILFDDVPLCLENPYELIGTHLRNKDEAVAVQNLMERLDPLFARYGSFITPDQAMSDKDWHNIVSLAKLAKQAFESHPSA